MGDDGQCLFSVYCHKLFDTAGDALSSPGRRFQSSDARLRLSEQAGDDLLVVMTTGKAGGLNM